MKDTPKFSIDDIAEVDRPEREEIDELNKLVAIQINLAEATREQKEEKRNTMDYYVSSSIKKTLDLIDLKIALMNEKAKLALAEIAPSPEEKEKEKSE